MANTKAEPIKTPIPNDVDPAETAEWLESLDYVLESKGPERVGQIISALEETANRYGVELPFTATTPYVNTIPRRQAAPLPRQSRTGTPHQELRPLERDGDGHPREPRPRGTGRTHLDVRLVGHAVRSRAQSLYSRTRRKTATTATRFTTRATRLRGCTLVRFWKAGSPSSTW